MTTPRDPARTPLGDDLEVTSSAIRADIERTRERLGETVEALGAQLNPTHLKQRVKDSVREATIGRVQNMASTTRDRITGSSRDLAQHIRDNPLPAAVAAAGIGWLLFRAREGERPLLRRAVRRRLADAARALSTTNSMRMRAGHSVPTSANSVRRCANAPATCRSACRKRSNASSSGPSRSQRESLNACRRRRSAPVKPVTASRSVPVKPGTPLRNGQGKHAVPWPNAPRRRRVAVKEGARNTAHRVEHSYNESPIGMGAVALAIGLAIGYSLPATRREARVMGDSRDRLVDKARERVADARERIEGAVERATPEVKAAIRDAARDTGITG